MSAHRQKNKQIMKKPYIRVGNPREGILEIGPQVKPIKGKGENPRKPIKVEFLREEEKKKGTYDVSTLDRLWSSKFNVKSSRNLGQRKHGIRGKVLEGFSSSSISRRNCPKKGPIDITSKIFQATHQNWWFNIEATGVRLEPVVRVVALAIRLSTITIRTVSLVIGPPITVASATSPAIKLLALIIVEASLAPNRQHRSKVFHHRTDDTRLVTYRSYEGGDAILCFRKMFNQIFKSKTFYNFL